MIWGRKQRRKPQSIGSWNREEENWEEIREDDMEMRRGGKEMRGVGIELGEEIKSTSPFCYFN